jgi:hypothetical protein
VNYLMLFAVYLVRMAIQNWTPDKPINTGKVPTAHTGLSAADTFKFPNNGRVALRVTAKTTETKVKVAFTQGSDGQIPAPREVAVKEATKLIGPFPVGSYNDEEGNVSFTLTSATEVTVELVQI